MNDMTNVQIEAEIIAISGNAWDAEVLSNAVAAVKRGDKRFLADSVEADALIALIKG